MLGGHRLAERVGFEPTCPLRTRRFRGAPVTTTSVPLHFLLRSVEPLFPFSTSLRARGRLRRLPSGARLRPQALSYFARWSLFFHAPPPASARQTLARASAQQAAARSGPPALACGRRRFPSLGGAPLHSPSRCAAEALSSFARTANLQSTIRQSPVANRQSTFQSPICNRRSSVCDLFSAKKAWTSSRQSASSTRPVTSKR